jgi:L-rhamnose-H+ transport protein
MPYLKKWSWENIWLIYSISAYLALPWPFALLTIPHILNVFSTTPHEVILRTLVLGFAWGLAVVLYGLGIDRLGLALGTAIIIGLGTSVGSLVPLVGLHHDRLWASSGVAAIAGVLLLLTAVVLLSVAGKQRKLALKARGGQDAADMGLVRSGRFLAGLLICILCGLLSPLLNIIFVYSSEIQRQAIYHEANPTSAANAVWLLVANTGFLPSLFHSLFLLQKNGTWGTFRLGRGWYWFMTPLMGLMWVSCIVMYGVGANKMGSLGPVIGWPAFVSTTVLGAAFWGFLAREWKGITDRPIYIQTGALVVLVAAMFTLGLASRL